MVVILKLLILTLLYHRLEQFCNRTAFWHQLSSYGIFYHWKQIVMRNFHLFNMYLKTNCTKSKHCQNCKKKNLPGNRIENITHCQLWNPQVYVILHLCFYNNEITFELQDHSFLMTLIVNIYYSFLWIKFNQIW